MLQIHCKQLGSGVVRLVVEVVGESLDPSGFEHVAGDYKLHLRS